MRPEPPPGAPDELVQQVRRRTLGLVGSDERPAPVYAELRGLLARVPREQRDPAWVETSVLTDVAFRRRAALARRRLRSLLSAHREAGDEEAFATLWDLVRRLGHPYVLVAHGYRLPLDQRDQSAVWRDVVDLVDGLADLGYAACVISGTLLGLVRDGRLISYDDDLDLAVRLTATDAASVAAEWARLGERCEQAGLLNERYARDAFVHLKAHTATGVAADLFPCWVQGDRAWVWPHTAGTASAAELAPFAVREVSGLPIPVPADPEPFLVANYGPGWRTPDPSWQFPWKQARQRFPEFWAALGRSGADEGSGS